MGKRIPTTAGTIEATGEVGGTKTAQAIWEALSIKGRVNFRGDEIYFPILISLKLEDGQEVVSIRDLAYWPNGNLFCIFFRHTPVSERNQIRPASPVTVFGKIIGDATIFGKVATRTKITVENRE